jgi:hypothetical protein
MFGHSKTKDCHFLLNIKSVEESNLFLRKLWTEFRKESTFSSMSMPTKDGSQQFVTLGMVNFGKNPGSGVSVKYEMRGCIQELVFNMFPIDYEDFLNDAIAIALTDATNPQPAYEVSYLYESFVGQIQPFAFNGFTLYPVEDNKNLLTLNVPGFDFIDAATQHKATADRLFSLFALIFKTYFSCTKVLAEHSYTIESDNSYRVEERVDDFYTEYKFSADEFSLINFFFRNIENENLRKMHSALRLFHDGISVERTNGATVMDNKKEVALSLYMSALEVLASDQSPETSSCKKCDQTMYKIGDKVYKMVLHMSRSENLAKMIKQEYGKRSKYLHAGRFFSENNFLGHHIPQLDDSKESLNGNISQYADSGTLYTLHHVTHGAVIRRLQYLAKVEEVKQSDANVN